MVCCIGASATDTLSFVEVPNAAQRCLALARGTCGAGRLRGIHDRVAPAMPLLTSPVQTRRTHALCPLLSPCQSHLPPSPYASNEIEQRRRRACHPHAPQGAEPRTLRGPADEAPSAGAATTVPASVAARCASHGAERRVRRRAARASSGRNKPAATSLKAGGESGGDSPRPTRN